MVSEVWLISFTWVDGCLVGDGTCSRLWEQGGSDDDDDDIILNLPWKLKVISVVIQHQSITRDSSSHSTWHVDRSLMSQTGNLHLTRACHSRKDCLLLSLQNLAPDPSSSFRPTTVLLPTSTPSYSSLLELPSSTAGRDLNPVRPAHAFWGWHLFDMSSIQANASWDNKMGWSRRLYITVIVWWWSECHLISSMLR